MIAEATIREALDASRDQLLGEEGRLVRVSEHDPERDIDQIFVQLAKDTAPETPPAGSLLEACVDAARIWVEPVGDLTLEQGQEITRAVIQTLIDRTESPTTCAELTRILAGVV